MCPFTYELLTFKFYAKHVSTIPGFFHDTEYIQTTERIFLVAELNEINVFVPYKWWWKLKRQG